MAKPLPLPLPTARWLLALTLALTLTTTLLLIALPAPGEAKSSRTAAGKAGVSDARLVSGKRCTINRTARLQRSPRLRQREAKRARRCRRQNATDSAVPSSMYWGAWIGDQLTGDQAPWDMSAVSEFEGMAGKHASVINFGAPFANCDDGGCSFYDFPTNPMEDIRKHGSIPFLSWTSQSIPSSLNQPNFQLSDVIAGTYDPFIREFAEAAREWGHPFFLRFNWEMNGDWFSWSEGVNGNGPGEFVAAWRHVHDIFTSVGATNATWVWCPNVDPSSTMQDVAPLYPGDEYVDWTGLDGYNWGPSRPGGWSSFDEIYEASYQRITEEVAPSKPMIISEVGSTERGGSKADWIQEMLDELPTKYPKVRGLLYFERYDDGMDWPIETSSAATSAFATGISDPAYVSGDYSSLPPGPVQPPS